MGLLVAPERGEDGVEVLVVEVVGGGVVDDEAPGVEVAAAPPAATAFGFTGLPAPAGAVWWIGTWAIAAAGGPDTAVGVAWVLAI